MAKSRKNVRKNRKSFKMRNSRKNFRKMSGGIDNLLQHFKDSYCDYNKEKCKHRINKYILYVLKKYYINSNYYPLGEVDIKDIPIDTIDSIVDIVMNDLETNTSNYDRDIIVKIKEFFSNTNFKFKDNKDFIEMFKYGNIEYYLQTYQEGFEEGIKEGSNKGIEESISIIDTNQNEN